MARQSLLLNLLMLLNLTGMKTPAEVIHPLQGAGLPNGGQCISMVPMPLVPMHSVFQAQARIQTVISSQILSRAHSR